MAALSALQRFGFPWSPAAKATHWQELAGRFRSRLSPDAQNRASAKKRKLHSNPRYDPDIYYITSKNNVKYFSSTYLLHDNVCLCDDIFNCRWNCLFVISSEWFVILTLNVVVSVFIRKRSGQQNICTWAVIF